MKAGRQRQIFTVGEFDRAVDGVECVVGDRVADLVVIEAGFLNCWRENFARNVRDYGIEKVLRLVPFGT